MSAKIQQMSEPEGPVAAWKKNQGRATKEGGA